MANKGKKFPPEVFTVAEIKKLLCNFPPTQFGVRHRAMTAIMLYAQLRISECIDLLPCDIDWEANRITVRCGKGGKRRVCGINPTALTSCVKPWQDMRDPRIQWFFHTTKGRKLAHTTYCEALRRAAARAKINRRAHAHALRHTGAFVLARANVHPMYIQRQLGHSSLEVTGTYLNHLGATDAADVVSKIDF